MPYSPWDTVRKRRYRACAARCGTWILAYELPFKRFCSQRCRQRAYRARLATRAA